MNNPLSPTGQYPEPTTPAAAPPTTFEQLQIQDQYNKTAPSLWEAATGTTLAYDLGSFLGSRYEFDQNDPNWRDANRNRLMEILQTTPIEYHDDILSSNGIDEAVFTKMSIDEKSRFIRRVGESGAIGYGSMIGINLLEGSAFGIATFGASAPALLGNSYRGIKSLKTIAQVARASDRASAAKAIAQNASRLSLFARGAGVGAADALAFTAIDSIVDPTVEAQDFAYAGAFGSILGGSFNSMLGRSQLARRLERFGRKYESDLMNRGIELPPRFGATDVAEQIARRFGVEASVANAMLRFFDALDIDLSELAVGGRLSAADAAKVKTTIKFQDKGFDLGALEVLDDGRLILRSFFNDNPNEGAAMRGMVGVIRQRLFNADIPETHRGGITDADIRAIDDWLGNSRRAPRTRGAFGVPGGPATNMPTGGAPGRMGAIADWTPADEREFINGFMRWMMSADVDSARLSDQVYDSNAFDIPESVIPAFMRIREILARVYDGVNDPRFLSTPNQPKRVNRVFEKTLVKQVTERAKREKDQLLLFQQALSGGSDDALEIPDGEAIGSDKDWNDTPRIFGIEGFGSKLTSQAISAMTSPIGKIRWLAMQMHFTRVAPRTNDMARRMVGQPTTINEYVHRIKAVTELRLLRAFNKNLNEFIADGKDYTQIGKAERMKSIFRHEKRRQFNQMVYEEIHAPGTHSDKNVKAAAEAWRKEVNTLRELAKKSGVKGFEALAEDPTYFPRLYKWNAIDAFVLRHGQDEFKKLLLNALDKTDFEPEQADALATLLSERLLRIARGERKSGSFNINQVVQEILSEMDRPTTPAGPILTPRARYRFRADVLTRLEDGSSASLSDLVERDVTVAFSSYVRSLAGAIGETKLINRYKTELLARGATQEAVDKINTWADLIDDIKKSSRSLSSDEMNGHIDSLGELRATMRSEPDPSSFGTGVFNTVFSENARRLMKIAYLQRGGSFALAQINELARTISRAGFDNVWRQLPTIKELLDSARQGRQVNELASLMEQAFGLGSDRLRRTTGRIDDALNAYPPHVRAGWYQKAATKMAKVDEKLDALVFAFADLSGLAPLTSATQHLTAMSLIQRLHSISAGRSKNFSPAIIRQWGLEDSQYQAVVKAVGRHAKLDSRGRVIDIDMDNISNDDFRALMTFLERGTIATIQDPPTRGDLHKFFFTPLGKMLVQFRTFNTKGIDSFLRTTIQRKDFDVVREYLMTGILAMLTQTFRKQLRYASITDAKERKKYEKENFSPGAYASYFMSGPTENYLLMIGTDSLSQFLLGQSTFGSRVRYSGLSSSPFDVSGTPAWAAIDSVYKAAQGPTRAMLRSDYDFSQRDLHAIFNSLPAARAVIIGEGLSKLEEYLGSNLPEESKKGTK